MNRASLRKRLEPAELHVAEGAARIRRQRELLAELARDGHLATSFKANWLLGEFEETQALFAASRDRFKDELAEQAVRAPSREDQAANSDRKSRLDTTCIRFCPVLRREDQER